MRHALIRRALILLLPVSLAVVALQGQGAPPAPPATADQPAPKDLRPLLTPRASEMRLVTARYTLDRVTLIGNYLGGGRAREMRGQEAPPPEPLSAGRIVRLRQFDRDWQKALGALDPSTLSPAARTDLASLQKTI